MTQVEKTVLTAQNTVADHFGDLAEFWGFARSAGRIYGLLYTSPIPLDQGSIRQQLGLSVGSVSMSLQQLLDWEVVAQNGRCYHAQTDLFRLALKVLQRREMVIAAELCGKLTALHVELVKIGAENPDQRVLFLSRRLREFIAVIELAQTLLEALAGGRPLQRIIRALTTRSAKRLVAGTIHHVHYF